MAFRIVGAQLDAGKLLKMLVTVQDQVESLTLQLVDEVAAVLQDQERFELCFLSPANHRLVAKSDRHRVMMQDGDFQQLAAIGCRAILARSAAGAGIEDVGCVDPVDLTSTDRSGREGKLAKQRVVGIEACDQCLIVNAASWPLPAGATIVATLDAAVALVGPGLNPEPVPWPHSSEARKLRPAQRFVVEPQPEGEPRLELAPKVGCLVKHHAVEPFPAEGVNDVAEVEQVVISRHDEEFGARTALLAKILQFALGGEQQQGVGVVDKVARRNDGLGTKPDDFGADPLPDIDVEGASEMNV